MKAWIEWDDDPVTHIVIENHEKLDKFGFPELIFVKYDPKTYFENDVPDGQ